MHDTTGVTDRTFTRRMFLARGLTFASLTATAPLFIERSARASYRGAVLTRDDAARRLEARLEAELSRWRDAAPRSTARGPSASPDSDSARAATRIPEVQ